MDCGQSTSVSSYVSGWNLTVLKSPDEDEGKAAFDKIHLLGQHSYHYRMMSFWLRKGFQTPQTFIP